MGRYATVTDVRDRLRGVNLNVWLLSQLGGSTAELERLLEQRLSDGEAQVDEHCQRQFVPLVRHTETISGKGSVQLRLRNAPIYDILQIQIRADGFSSVATLTAADLRLDRAAGIVSIKPSLPNAGALPLLGPNMAYRNQFGHGRQNVVAQYRSAYAVVGDNISLTQLADEGWDRVAAVSTDASYAYFDPPVQFAPYRATVALSTLPSIRMLKDGVDDSANWSAVSPTRLRVAIGSYAAAARYVLVYVPWAVSGAAAETAAALALLHKGVTDGSGGSGGVVSLTAQGFREDYGDFQYAGQAKAFIESARSMLHGFRRALIA
jgi:hypothetical protein